MTFHVGQKVTPKRDAPWPDRGVGEMLPQFGEVYTIIEIEGHPTGPGLRFAELRNTPRHYKGGFCEVMYCAAEFRPVVDNKRETDISVFKKLLNNIPVEVA